MMACDMSPMMWVMWGGGLLLLGALVALGWWGVRQATRRHDGTPASLQVLEDRFARGEIDAEEYRSRRRLLGEAR